MDTCTMDKFEV